MQRNSLQELAYLSKLDKAERLTKRKQHLTNWTLNAALRDSGTDQLYRVDDRTIHLDFHEGQWRTWQSRARFVGVFAGTQGGKTTFGPWWLYREIQEHGSGDYIALTATYDLFKLKMLPAMLEIFVDVLGVAYYHRGDKVLQLRNPETGKLDGNSADDPNCWGRIILRSADAKRGLESSSAKAVWFDEGGQDGIYVDVFEALQRRLSLSQGRMLITTTLYNLGWLKQHIYDPWRRGADNIDVIQFASSINPAFPDEEEERMRSTMQTWKYLMFYKGEYSRPPGMIYTDFVDDYHAHGGHKCREFTIPENWPVYVGVDPGIINTAKVWLAHDIENDIYYLFKEQLGDRKPAGDHAEEALEYARDNKLRVVKWMVGAVSEKYHRQDWIEAGARGVVSPPEKEVEKGIDAVTQMLKLYQLVIVETCTGTLEQLATYSRVLDNDGEPTEKIKDKSKYHYLDALRYFAIGVQTTAYKWHVQAKAHKYA